MLIKKLFLTAFLIFLLAFPACSAHDADIKISAESAVVINADTREIIFEKNAFLKKSMASTTKIMTSLIAVESGLLSQKVTVQDSIHSEGTSIGLKEGNVLTLETLVYAMMLESGNDSAEVTAEYFSGSEERFSDLMNKKASSIGMKHTNFVTASGLDSEEHYSTAFDMAILGAYAVKNPLFRRFCSVSEKSVDFIEPELKATFTNHNKLLKGCDGVFGIKTGFTKKSGRCLVTACKRNDVTLVAVTLNAYDDWNDHIKLYDKCFGMLNSEIVSFSLPLQIKIYGGEKSVLNIETERTSYKYAYVDRENVSVYICLPKLVYAPIKKGQVLGEVQFISDSKLLSSLLITASENITAVSGREYRKSLFERIKDHIKNHRLKGKFL